MSERKIEAERYTRRGEFFLDHDDGGYTNSYVVLDRGKAPGISFVDTGHSKFPNSHKRRVLFKGEQQPTLRAAIYAYEDSATQEQTHG